MSGSDAPWRTALRWGERLLWVGAVAFIAIRLGPQLGALLGVGPAEGSRPEYSVTTLHGERLTSASLQGQVVVVNFWATWCPPCRFEIPALQTLHEELADQGVVVLGISTDVGGEEEIRGFLQERAVSYPVARATRAVRQAFGGISALPTTFILDRDGVIRHRVQGFFAPPAMGAAVRRLLQSERATGFRGPADLPTLGDSGAPPA